VGGVRKSAPRRIVTDAEISEAVALVTEDLAERKASGAFASGREVLRTLNGMSRDLMDAVVFGEDTEPALRRLSAMLVFALASAKDFKREPG
jgi:hypothetical protein